jgi:CRP/FNR family transcriptional regulator, cyclic AMP receptor protein
VIVIAPSTARPYALRGENLVSSLRQRRSMTQPKYIPTLAKPDKHAAASDARLWSNVLATVPLFAGLSRRHLNKVASAGRIARFHHQTAIVRAGEPGDTFYVVLDGEVSVRRPAGPELTRGIGSFFGEISLLDGGPRSATVVARGPVVCLALSQARFAKVLRAEPAIAVAMLKELAERLRTAQAMS